MYVTSNVSSYIVVVTSLQFR